MKRDAVFTTWATSCVNMRRCSYTSLVTHVRYTLSLIHADRHRKSDDKVITWMRATQSLPRDSAELFLAGEKPTPMEKLGGATFKFRSRSSLHPARI